MAYNPNKREAQEELGEHTGGSTALPGGRETWVLRGQAEGRCGPEDTLGDKLRAACDPKSRGQRTRNDQHRSGGGCIPASHS